MVSSEAYLAYHLETLSPCLRYYFRNKLDIPIVVSAPVTKQGRRKVTAERVNSTLIEDIFIAKSFLPAAG
jgi:hypothetical protein